MLELILIVNLAFSICGFVFIVRMWKEVKARRDYYGENFGIPKGMDYTQERQQQAPVSLGIDAAQIAALAAVMAQGQQQQKPAANDIAEGDLQKIIEVAASAGKGGAL